MQRITRPKRLNALELDKNNKRSAPVTEFFRIKVTQLLDAETQQAMKDDDASPGHAVVAGDLVCASCALQGGGKEIIHHD